MDAQTSLSIQQVVQQVVEQVGLLTAVTSPIVFGILEAFKKAFTRKNGSKMAILRFTGFLAPVVGVIVNYFIAGMHFTPIGILVGVIGGFATSGAFSATKSATKPANE